MHIKITKSIFIIGFLLFFISHSGAQITKLQDYLNNTSPTIGNFQGITFREAGFSGLYPIPGTNGTEFWTLSDRGVNVDCGSANSSSCRPTYDKMYAFPGYAPKIHRIRITGSEVQILQTITIKRPNGSSASGIINPTGLGSTAIEVASTDTVLDCANFNLKTTPKDTFGIDPEGIVVDKDGNFWLCEEGGATIWKLNPNGVLLKRYTPYANLAGVQSVDVQIDTVFKYRKNNRGFEGIALAPNGKIYAIIQSPLLYPNTTIGEGTRIHRILEIDPATNSMRTIVYLNDGIVGSGSNQIRLRDWKIGDMAAVNDSVFLVLEAAARGTTDIKRLYKININQATTVTSGLYGTQTLEALVDSTGLAGKGIIAVKKTLVMDLLANGWPSTLDKAEGLAIVNDSTIAICNDNDFGQTCPNADGIAIPTTNVSHLITFSLKGNNKLSNYQAANPPSNAIQDYSFVVLGCNRVETDDSVGNPSTANVYQLNRVFTEISQMNPLPKYLFFAGDMVLGYENDTIKLASQLSNWLAIYNVHPIKNLPVQLVAIEGNHETQDKANGKKSFIAAERTFLRVMGNYILGNNGPTITGLLPGTDSLTTDQSKLTYSFNYKNDHFVIVNTDPVGRDGMASYKWIGNDIANARANGARHIFAIGHKPAYTGHFKSTPDGLENNISQRDSFWNVLEKNQADAFFSAHIHASDSLQPHPGKTWQVIAGNGGSLVEPTFTTFPNAYFGYVTVHVFDNDSVNVKSWGRDATMTTARYQDSTPSNPTTLRASYNLNINPIIRHTPLSNTLSNGPFTISANITDNIAVTGAQLNYNINGISKTAIVPTISGNTYTFVIPAVSGYGMINYNIQANDASLIKIYSSVNGSSYHSFSFGPLSQQGPNSSQTPYLVPVAPGVIFNSVLSTPDSLASGYKMAGIPDGLGAFDNGNGTFTLLMNHELGANLGVVRAHGSVGAFVSRWIINKSNLSVVSGSDLMQNVNIYDTTSQTYTTYNASNPSSKASFVRFCAADLPQVPAFYNASSGKGTQERIFMNGEENNDESRALAHIVTGVNAGTTWELPALGKAAWENAVATPNSGDKTVVALTNDGTDGQVYFYMGTKTTTGTEVDKAGLNNGKPYGVKVTGFAAERTSSTSNIAIPTPGTRFSLVDLGNVKQLSGVAFNTLSNNNGVTKFSRPEDGAWDPSSPKDFYFNTTDQLDQVNDGIGSQVGRTRVWRLRFDSIQNPELGGTIEAVLDGTEGANMFDNMTIDKYGHILLQEDVGNAAHNGKIYQYTIATDKLILVAKHDPSRFGDIGVSATAPFNQDEESSGIIDMQDILGAGMFLTADQAHYAISGAAVEGGQLMAMFNPDTYYSSLGRGVSSSQTPYLLPVASGVKLNSIISVNDSTANGYKMAGIPDGLGAFDNGNGTFTLLMNHELGANLGVVRSHGSVGAFVSRWIINKSNLAVVSGSDLMQNVNIYDTTSQTYTTYNASNPSSKASFVRFCAADLPQIPAFYNASSGKGTQERIFMNGEENNDESRALAHIVTGVNAGTTWELPALGKAAWENAVATPNSGDKTVVALTNDGTDGQVYFYIGTKTTTGTEVDKAGLNNGKPYGVKVTGFAAERTSSTSNIAIPTPGTRFSLVYLGNVKQLSGVAFNTLSNNNGVTKFSRPEDGAWDPSSPKDFYFNTTDQLDQVNDGIGSQVGRTRVWRLRFDSIQNPELGGTIEAVLDGTEGANMFDNMTIDKYGHILLQEDVGNAAHNGKIYQYTIATDKLVLVAKHDPSRFGDIGVAATAPFNQDEESSGIIDMQDILGAGMFLTADQAHYAISGAAVEGGQLMAMFNPDTYNSSLGQGVSSSQTPYLLPVASGVKFTSVLSTPDSLANGYKMAGIPDGLGAFDNGNGTFTLLMNHEIVNNLGVVRAHGSIGSYISKWVINKSNLSVVSGSDLMQNVNLYDTTTQTYTTYNTTNPSSKAAFGRFCSADLPPVAAFYNASSGKGTTERIFMNGEETNDESRALAHIATGSNAGTTWELPALGKAAWENAVATPNSGDKTVVALTNDGTDGQVYFYIGTKTTTGTEVDKAGLNNGKPYGVKVTGFAAERTSSTSNIAIPTPGTRFSLVDLGNVKQLSGVAFNTLSNNNGVTKFSRPEDGAWDPSSPKDFYFNTTDQLDQVNDGIGSQVGRTRVWRLRFDSIQNPELGGTIEAVLDGTEGANMFDNMTIDKYGHILLQEDVGNAAHNGKIYQYTIATDKLVLVAKHDPSRFGDIAVAATAPFNQDEESSGIIDMQDILGAGMFFTADQAHYAISGAAVEGGQLMAMFNPYTDITSQPVSTSKCEGSNASFTVGVISTGTPTYQWFKDGNLISSANTATLSLNNITLSDSGNYAVVVSDENGRTSNSSVAKLTVIPKITPTITPTNFILCQNATVTLQASSSSTLVNTYQWKLNGFNIAGANSSAYVVNSASVGNYTVVINYTTGCSYESLPTTITSSPAPTSGFSINSSVQCINGNTFSFTNTSTISTGSLNYLWKFGDGSTSTSTSPVKTYVSFGTYYVTLIATSANGCQDSITKLVSVNPKPNASFSLNSTNQCLSNNSFQFTNTSGITSGSISYLWRFGDGTTSTIANPSKSYSSANIYTITLIVTSNFGCTDSTSLSVTINPNPAPTTPTGANTACSSINSVSVSPITYSTTLVSGLIYNWTVTGGTISGSSSGVNQNTVNVIWGSAGTGSVTVTATNTSTNCSGSATLSGITIYPSPTAIIAGPASVCLNSANNYSLSNATGGTIISFIWSATGGTIISGQGTSQINVLWATTGAKSVVCTLINSNGCIGTTSTFNLVVNPNPSVTFSGATTVCVGVPYTYTSGSSGSTYNWVPNGGSITTQTGNSVTIIWSNVAGASLLLNETLSTGCTGSSSQNIIVNGPLNAIISGATQACVSSVQTYFVSGATATSWSTTGGTITSSNTTGANVIWNTPGIQIINVSYSNGSCNYNTTYTVNVNPLPTPNVSGVNAVCTGTTVNYSTQFNPGRNYIWTVTAGGTIAGGQGTNNITVLWNSAGINSVAVTESFISTSCAATSTAFNVTVTALPGSSITGSSNVCSGGTFTYSAPTASTYAWSVSGGSISGSSNSANVTVVWGTGPNGSIVVTTSNGNCNSTSVLPVIINTTPNATIIGPGSICSGTTNQFSAPFNSNYIYTWTVSNGTFTIGANANIINVTPNSAVSSLTITLDVALTGTSCSASTSKVVSVNLTPSVTISGFSSVCENSTQTYTLSGAATYSFSVSGGIITTTTTNSLSVLWGNSNGLIMVTGTNLAGCTQTISLPVSINPLPIVSISGANQVCASSTANYSVNNIPGATYNWSVIGGIIYGNSNSNIATIIWGASGAGLLTVSVTNIAGCMNSKVLNVNINTQPTPNISGSLAVCQNSNQSYSVTAIAGAAYNWSVTGGNIVSGAGTNSVVVNWQTGGNGSINVTQGLGSCTGSNSRSILINAAPLTPAVYKAGNRLSTDAIAVGYQWYYNGTLLSGATSNSHTAILAGNYSLSVTNAAGCTTFSNTVIANVGIRQDAFFTELQVYPNPVTNELTVKSKLSKGEMVTLRIFDINGKQLYVENVKIEAGYLSKSIDMDGFASGIYIVQLLTDNGRTIQQKITKR